MKIVHINCLDNIGGAAKAAFRHFEAMRKIGIDATMLVVERNIIDSNIQTIQPNKYKLFFYSKIYNIIQNLFLKYLKPFAIFSYPIWGFNIHKHKSIKEADIIYIHWPGKSMLTIKGIEKILKLGKPVFWYMHDMNPITGGCHHSLECNKYQNDCKDCPFVRGKIRKYLVHKQFQKKIKHWYKYPNFNIVTPSVWLGNCAERSTLFHNKSITVCPNVINTDFFKPVDKHIARNILGVSLEKTIILFGADNLKNPYKGWEYLKDAINELDPNTFECLIFGQSNEYIKDEILINSHFTGTLHDEFSLILAYNSADLFISASIADNYPNVILESMSCGTPCVGFNVGGIPDLIHHKQTGYLASYKNTKDLVDGIKWICNNKDILSDNCRNFVIKNNSYLQIEKVHKELKNL